VLAAAKTDLRIPRFSEEEMANQLLAVGKCGIYLEV